MKKAPTIEVVGVRDNENVYAPPKIMKRANTRKYGYCAEKLHENLCLIFGTEPAKTVLAETTMVKDITDLFDSEYDKENLSIRIPDAFDHLKGADAKFEMVTSNSL